MHYVEPLVLLSKKNLIYNANKNTMLEELKDFSEELSSKMDDTRAELAIVQNLRQKVKDYKYDFQRGMVDCKTRSEKLDMTMEQINNRMDDFDQRLREQRDHMGIRDRKLIELIEHINKMKAQ